MNEIKEGPAATAGAATPPAMFPIRSPGLPPLETVTPIRPSEAIRLGCLTTAQGTGEFWPSPGQACALGAMALGWGFDPDGAHSQHDEWRFIDDRLPKGPVDVPGIGEWVDYSTAIYQLNDGEDWSRERIADWLEGLGL